MFVLTYAMMDQADPTVSVAVGNGVNHLFGILINVPRMSYVLVFDSMGQQYRTWSNPEADVMEEF